MPRPHAPHQPLRVPEHIVTRALEHQGRDRVRRAADGRVLVADPHASDHWWVGADLTCLCGHTDEPCEHQFVAALLRDHPIQLPPPDPEPGPLLHALRAQLQALPPLPPADCAPSLSSLSPRHLSRLELFRAMTEPGASDEAVLVALEAAHPEVTAPTADLALSLPHGRRAGPVHEMAAAALLDHLAPTAGITDLLRLQRLLIVAPDAAFVRHLDEAHAAAPERLATMLGASPLLPERAAALLPAPQLSRLLADPAMAGEPRERILRHLAARRSPAAARQPSR